MRWCLLLLIGCLRSASQECAGGAVCPEGLVCATTGSNQICVLSTCGNGQLDPGEVCDDGNNVSGDGCPASCTAPCGDGVIDPGEACDDGNTVDGDGCSADCHSLERCGNGVVDPGEACDDGNLASHDGCASTCRPEAAMWSNAGDAPAQGEDSIAYDAAHDAVVMFANHASAETWEWHGTWRKRLPLVSPLARRGQSMAYDAARKRVILFGGQAINGLDTGAETWSWDGVVWSQLHPMSSPPAVSYAGMTYDTRRQRIVLFGGDSTHDNAPTNETWEWDGATWSQVPTSFPPAREYKLAYDADRGRVVMFGGNGEGLLSDTWEYDGVQWYRKSPAVSPGVGYRDYAMAYDAERRRVVLIGGSSTSPSLTDTWEWDGTTWTARALSVSPTQDAYSGLVFDDRRRRLVLFTGPSPVDQPDATLHETWEWDGVRWARSDATSRTAPSARANAAMAFDAGRHEAVMFGGSELYNVLSVGETWGFAGGWSRWVEQLHHRTPPPRELAAMSYDPQREKMVLFGGVSNNVGLSDTWEATNGQWEPAESLVAPPGREGAALAYDPLRQVTVMFGGVQPETNTLLDDTWTWDGTDWTERHPTTQPPARAGHKMAFDPVRGRIVMMGGTEDPPPNDGTWEWDGSSWSLHAIASSPVGTIRALFFDRVRNHIVVVASMVGTQGGETWETDGTTWTQITTTPAPAFDATAYDDFGRRLIAFGGYANGATNAVWEWNGASWSETFEPAIPSARAASAIATDPVHHDVIMFGGGFVGPSGVALLGDTWLWDGTRWQLQHAGASPPSRWRSAMVFDPVRQRTVLFGGAASSSEFFDDTWEWSGTAWTHAASDGVKPPARCCHNMVFDPVRGTTMLFGGATTTAPYFLDDQWEWNGVSWSAVSVALRPPERYLAASTYDVRRKRAVLFGGRSWKTGATLDDLWEWDGQSWSEKKPIAAVVPSARLGHTLVYDPVRGTSILFGGIDGNDSVLADAWEWDGTSWTLLHPLVCWRSPRAAEMWTGTIRLASSGVTASAC